MQSLIATSKAQTIYWSQQYGYGFIHFESSYFGQQCARTAAQVVGTSGRFVYNGVILRSEVSRNFMRTTGEYNNCEADNKEICSITRFVDIIVNALYCNKKS